MKLLKNIVLLLLIAHFISCHSAENRFHVAISNIGVGWSNTSVNATIFRKNSIVSASGFQFVAYYDTVATVVLAKRKLGSDAWEIYQTQYKGNVKDAHNIISIAIDGEGFLHMSWDHHNNALNYCRSVEPYGLEMGEKQVMIGQNEDKVSYPEFYSLSNGNLLFAYRDGGSGNGNLVMNRYVLASKRWERLQSNFIDGEGERNAYWQICVGANDQILVSWVWRESPDVASNHDMCFAKSTDGGVSWQNSSGSKYQLPITQKTAEVIYPIAQNSNLINQTSMTTDELGNAYIATYFRNDVDSVTQFHLIYQKEGRWHKSTITSRTENFDLNGIGTRVIPVSRPQVLVGNQQIMVVFRDSDWGNHAVIAMATLSSMEWQTELLSPMPLGKWEPSFDTELWRTQHKLNLFIQNVGQGQGETTEQIKPQPVGILELGF